jgi:hypothetical protein
MLFLYIYTFKNYDNNYLISINALNTILSFYYIYISVLHLVNLALNISRLLISLP